MGDRARATIKVKVEILDADRPLFPDMSATAYFLPQEDEKSAGPPQRRVFCDANAVQSDGEAKFVWSVDAENRARRVDVKTGNQRDGRTEILEGLSGGERVIVSPPETIAEGTLVKLRD
jgi:multidrug efflux pump subunit AcrA (membrane-fusion protein)